MCDLTFWECPRLVALPIVKHEVKSGSTIATWTNVSQIID
jgi:hypothetical protein